MKINVTKQQIELFLSALQQEVSGLNAIVAWQSKMIEQLRLDLADEVAANAQMEYALRLLQEREDA